MVFQTQMPISLVLLAIGTQHLYMTKYKWSVSHTVMFSVSTDTYILVVLLYTSFVSWNTSLLVERFPEGTSPQYYPYELKFAGQFNTSGCN